MQNNAFTDKQLLAQFLELDQPDDGIQVMYIWIDGTGENMRGKTKTVTFIPEKAEGKDWPLH